MFKTIKQAFGTTHPQEQVPKLAPLPRRDHPALEYLLALDDARTICGRGLGHIRRELHDGCNAFGKWVDRHADLDRELLIWAGEWRSEAHLDMSSHWDLVRDSIYAFRAADIISQKLETMNLARMSPELRGALERFVAKLPSPSVPKATP